MSERSGSFPSPDGDLSKWDGPVYCGVNITKKDCDMVEEGWRRFWMKRGGLPDSQFIWDKWGRNSSHPSSRSWRAKDLLLDESAVES